ncbi:MAG: hypothetical protein K2X39_06105, partial [Silvanigrellaceae bacterium]|nr:hypothetical protein [Silvanigrellaceae bacterium]
MFRLSTNKQVKLRKSILSNIFSGYYSFIYVPENSKPAKSIKIPKFIFSFSLLIILSFTLVNSIIFSGIYLDSKAKNEISTLKKENQNLRSEAEFLNTRLKLIQQGLYQVNNLSDKIKKLTKIEEKIEKQKNIIFASFNKNHTYEKVFFEDNSNAVFHDNLSNFFDINTDALEFRTLFETVGLVAKETEQQIAGLKKLIIDTQLYNKFSQNYPDILPIKGILVSNFGWRLNPITH